MHHGDGIPQGALEKDLPSLCGYLKAFWPGLFGTTKRPYNWFAGLSLGATGTAGRAPSFWRGFAVVGLGQKVILCKDPEILSLFLGAM